MWGFFFLCKDGHLQHKRASSHVNSSSRRSDVGIWSFHSYPRPQNNLKKVKENKENLPLIKSTGKHKRQPLGQAVATWLNIASKRKKKFGTLIKCLRHDHSTLLYEKKLVNIFDFLKRSHPLSISRNIPRV